MKNTPLSTEPEIHLMSEGVEPTPPQADSAPEVSGTEAALVEWDEPVESSGHRVPRIGLDDEESIATRLVEQGLDQADDSLRHNAE